MEPADVPSPSCWSSSRSSSVAPTRVSSPRQVLYGYRSIPAREWKGIYPPVLPPPDFFDMEEEEKKIKEKMFKKDDFYNNHLYDERDKVNLPVDEKGILILDPVSRTRLIDAQMEVYIVAGYLWWIESAINEVGELQEKQSMDWVAGLRHALHEDHGTVKEELDIVIDEERKKRGLTDLKA